MANNVGSRRYFRAKMALGALRGDKTVQTPQAQQRGQDVINRLSSNKGGAVE